jgi:hypothetical protein
MAAAAWEYDGQARQLAHQAETLNRGNWSDDNNDLGAMRDLAWTLSDAALYADLIGNHARAGEIITDGMHLADLIDEKPARSLRRVEAGAGIYGIMVHSLEVVASGVVLTDDPGNTRDLQVKTAREIIARLLQVRNPKEQLIEVLGPADSQAWKDNADLRLRQIENLNKGNADQACAAISLACHLFRFDTGRWPNSLAELTPTYLPEVPIDPFGQGKPMGYVLLEHGLPDGGKRPLVYFRCDCKDGLAYRVEQPFYGWEEIRVPGPTGDRIKSCGQFRDIARWTPKAGKTEPTTRPLADS